MTRTNLLATTALCVMGCLSATAAMAKTGEMVGTVDIGYSYFNQDFDNSSYELDVDTFQGSGTVGKYFWPNVFGQGDFAFVSQHFDQADGGENWAVNASRIGINVFWRDEKQGLVGGELAYNSLDDGKQGPGFRIGVRGEYFFDGNTTFGGALGYHEFDFQNDSDYDGFYGNLWGKYYVQSDVAFSLRYDYSSLDQSDSVYDFDQWSLTGEGEYLLPECDTAIYGGVTFGNQEWDNSSDIDEWGINVGFRFYLNQDGGLSARQRSGTVAPTVTGLRPYF